MKKSTHNRLIALLLVLFMLVSMIPVTVQATEADPPTTETTTPAESEPPPEPEPQPEPEPEPQPEPQPEPTPAPTGDTYTVVAGDCLWNIAYKLYAKLIGADVMFFSGKKKLAAYVVLWAILFSTTGI